MTLHCVLLVVPGSHMDMDIITPWAPVEAKNGTEKRKVFWWHCFLLAFPGSRTLWLLELLLEPKMTRRKEKFSDDIVFSWLSLAVVLSSDPQSPSLSQSLIRREVRCSVRARAPARTETILYFIHEKIVNFFWSIKTYIVSCQKVSIFLR